ncbi:MAG: hypothetical protein ABGY72_21355 [bacterium]
MEQVWQATDTQLNRFNHIEVFYNRQRRHSLLGNRRPAEYEAALGGPN